MKYILSPALLLFLLPCFSQDYSYMRYDVNDGLAGSNVYCITQDKEGFLWMGTEGGLSRFDGVHFTNFTLEDGLPDIEVLQIMADSRERIWMGPFSQSVCYYYQGRIHNQENDTLLKKIHIRSGILNFAEDKEGNILINEVGVLHLVTTTGIVRDFDSIRGKPIYSYAVSKGSDGHFLVQDGDEVYRFDGKVFTHFFSIDFGSENSNFIVLRSQMFAWQGKEHAYRYRFASLKLGKTFDFDAERNAMLHVSFSVVSDSTVYRNSTRGTREYNLFTGTVRDFSIGARISRTFRDDEGNLWFTSLGQGVFRLNSENIRNIKLMDKYSASWVPLTMRRIGDQLLVGGSNSMLYQCSLSSPEHFTLRELKHSGEANEIRYLAKMKDGRLLVGSSMRLFYENEV
ncbi:MAG TPA: two-component regulator propeller domain-containing protein, partial [Puia sp.]|nr:two-component regulator propeller domain-containing protein [Puia sp.]